MVRGACCPSDGLKRIRWDGLRCDALDWAGTVRDATGNATGRAVLYCVVVSQLGLPLHADLCCATLCYTVLRSRLHILCNCLHQGLAVLQSCEW